MINPLPQGLIGSDNLKIKKKLRWIFYNDLYCNVRIGWHILWILLVIIIISFAIVYFTVNVTYYAKIIDGNNKKVYELHDCEAKSVIETSDTVKFEKDGVKYSLSNYLIETKSEKVKDFTERTKDTICR